MKITQDVRDYAATLNEKEAGMAEMSDKFNAMGQQVYVDADKVKAPHTTAIDTEAAHARERTRSSLVSAQRRSSGRAPPSQRHAAAGGHG